MKTAKQFRKEKYGDQRHLFSDQEQELIDQMMEEYASQNTLDRDRVMEILTKQDENGNYWEILRYKREIIGVDNLLTPYDGTEEFADAICSLTIPSVSELSEVWLKFSNHKHGDILTMEYFDFMDAIKELLNQNR